jgi:predicted unusual protein kinase regulating ubiquinone biosynthesis (AarF/ABC1/UbiB family)
MFQYIKSLYSQIKKLYQIRKQLKLIHNELPIHQSIDDLIPEFKKLKLMIFDCGSLYVKFLQWYISKLKSNVIDVNTLEMQNTIKFIDYFEDIFENCPFHSIESTKEIFANSMFGIKLEEYIDITTLKEIASGSIGQVYYACRLSDGKEIAIKVKHPDITNDLANQLELIKLLKYLQSFNYIKKKFNLIFNIDDFMNDILQQCNFCIEANNNKQFQDNFKDSRDFIIFPEIYYKSKDVLISDYIPGFSIDTLTDMQRYQTTINFVCFVNQMLLVDNFVHGDLHCKNWKVRLLSNGKPQIIVYDCGICFKNINIEISKNFWFSLVKYDIEKLKIALSYFILTPNTYILNDINSKINETFDLILIDGLGISLLLKTLIAYFTKNNIIIHKFLLNFCILMCVIEEFFKKNEIVNRNNKHLPGINMFDIINDEQLDIIAFCTVNKCYPEVCILFQKELENKYQEYKANVKINNINEHKIELDIADIKIKPILFNILTLSNLKFRPPESIPEPISE